MSECEAEREAHQKSSDEVKVFAEDLRKAARRRDRYQQQIDEDCPDLSTEYCKDLDFNRWAANEGVKVFREALEEELKKNMQDLISLVKCLGDFHKPSVS